MQSNRKVTVQLLSEGPSSTSLRGRGKMSFHILHPVSATDAPTLSSSIARRVEKGLPALPAGPAWKAAMAFVLPRCRQNCAIGQLLPNDKIINNKNNKPPVLCLPSGRFWAEPFAWIFLRTGILNLCTCLCPCGSLV